MTNSCLDMIADASADPYDHRRRLIQRMDSSNLLDSICALSSAHAAILYSILHGRGQFNAGIAIRHICRDTQMPKRVVVQCLSEIRACRAKR